MSDKEFPSCAYDVCAEFDCEETMALALIATRTELERTKELLDVESAEHEMCHIQMLKTTEKLDRTRKALDVAVDALEYIRRTNPISFHFEAIEKALEQINQKENQ